MQVAAGVATVTGASYVSIETGLAGIAGASASLYAGGGNPDVLVPVVDFFPSKGTLRVLLKRADGQPVRPTDAQKISWVAVGS